MRAILRTSVMAISCATLLTSAALADGDPTDPYGRQSGGQDVTILPSSDGPRSDGALVVFLVKWMVPWVVR